MFPQVGYRGHLWSHKWVCVHSWHHYWGTRWSWAPNLHFNPERLIPWVQDTRGRGSPPPSSGPFASPPTPRGAVPCPASQGIPGRNRTPETYMHLRGCPFSSSMNFTGNRAPAILCPQWKSANLKNWSPSQIRFQQMPRGWQIFS